VYREIFSDCVKPVKKLEVSIL